MIREGDNRGTRRMVTVQRAARSLLSISARTGAVHC
jgi:hypothetical protein